MSTVAGQLLAPVKARVEPPHPMQHKADGKTAAHRGDFDQALETAEAAHGATSQKAKTAAESGKDLPQSTEPTKQEPVSEVGQHPAAATFSEIEFLPRTDSPALVAMPIESIGTQVAGTGTQQPLATGLNLTNPGQLLPQLHAGKNLAKTGDIQSDLLKTGDFQGDLLKTGVVQSGLQKPAAADFRFNNSMPMLDTASNSIAAFNPGHLPSNTMQSANTLIEGANNSLPTLSLPLPLSPSDQNWGKAIAQRVLLAVHSNFQQAEIQITPANLGPIELQIKMSLEGASVHFVSPYPQVRDALNDAMPKLQELFEEQGMHLSDSQVHDQTPESKSEKHAAASLSEQNDAAIEESGISALRRQISSLYQVDEFA